MVIITVRPYANVMAGVVGPTSVMVTVRINHTQNPNPFPQPLPTE